MTRRVVGKAKIPFEWQDLSALGLVGQGKEKVKLRSVSDTSNSFAAQRNLKNFKSAQRGGQKTLRNG